MCVISSTHLKFKVTKDIKRIVLVMKWIPPYAIRQLETLADDKQSCRKYPIWQYLCCDDYI
ncbi:unnamed protein product [Onchocerca flexuosa]|uniref:Ovule protein n=1 Tax=Onchocerca flexuosa TaxID=387005 RepID=A0A183HMS2_9BILA|nr:unnamed protein product [Onchocerca flexuosa]